MKNKKGLIEVKKPAKIGFLSYVADFQGCGHIRVVFPHLLMNHYRQPGVTINTTFLAQYITDPNFYNNYTFVIFQRSATEAHLKLIEKFKKEVQQNRRIPLIYEIDDMLIGIPEWNYAHNYYKKHEDIIKRIMSSVNGIIVSTQRLKENYSQYNKNIIVSPNHLPKFIWGDIYPKHEYYDEKEKIKILWPGSMNHFYVPQLHNKSGIKGGDFGDELIDFVKKTLNVYDWIFMGAMPPQLETHKDKIQFVPWENIFNYPRVVKELEADIGIAPLQQIEFNANKSNIKAHEFIAAGMVGVYTKIEPYKFMTMQSSSDQEMIAHIERLAKDTSLRRKTYWKDYEVVRENLFWEENNNIRKHINSHLNLFNQTLPRT